MKKVLSVALASAMVLGMGANAFAAIQYSTGSNDTASWPKGFQFDGQLFVTDKDDKIVKESTTRLNDSEAVDFQPGDVIWMPLYAKDQVVYESQYEAGTADKNAVTTVKANVHTTVTNVDNWHAYQGNDGVWYWEGSDSSKHNAPAQPADTVLVESGKVSKTGLKYYKAMRATLVSVDLVGTDYKDRTIVANSERYFVGASEVNKNEYLEAVAKNVANTYVTVNLAKEEGKDEEIGKIYNDGKIADYYNYTGNIDKNWSINLVEKDGTVKDLIKKAELYKATSADYHSYKGVTDQIKPNAVYLKVTLKDEWKTTSSETLKYYVYLADNKGNKTENEVWVSGNYAPSYKWVDFTWTNDASEAGLWKVRKNESGTAVFDFADKAFFTVKMYGGESMYLDLETAYDKAIAGEMDADADSFYKFDKANANFARAGELVIVSDDDTLVPYEIDEDGNFVEVDAEYVENYLIKNSNAKVNGFKFNTKQLGNYVLSTEELGAEDEEVEEEVEEEEVPEVEETPEVEEVPETDKPNPNTGAEDFVGLAVSLAVVSVAAAGALALKK